MDQFITDLLGETIFIKEDMNMGLRGRIRAVRSHTHLINGAITGMQHGYRFSVQILEGAAAGDMIDLRVDQIKFRTKPPSHDQSRTNQPPS